MRMMKKALVVGIDDYAGNPLYSSVNDAAAIAAILETNDDGSSNFHVKMGTDIKRREELTAAIDDLFSRQADVAIFFFSGHGYFDHNGGYIVTPDAGRYEIGVSMDMILQFVNRSPVRNKIIILDCCHSGAFGGLTAMENKHTFIADGVTILTASRSDEYAIGTHTLSLFTRLLLEGLKGGASEVAGYITPGSLYGYVDQALGPWHQRPVFKTNVSSFVSLRRVRPLLPLEVLRRITTYFETSDQIRPLDPTYEYTNEEVATAAHVAIFKDLQKMERAGLVSPMDEEFMYWAAQHSKGCILTPIGRHYWRLVKDNLLD